MGFTARSRKADPSRLKAAAIMAKLLFAIGISLGSLSTDISRSTRSIRTFFMATGSRARSRILASTPRLHRSRFAAASIGSGVTLAYSPLEPHTLYFAANVLFKTTDAGNSWQVISPDLTRESYEIPANLGVFAASDPEKGKHRGVIYAVAAQAVEQSFHHRSFALRCGHGVRGDQFVPARRFTRTHLPHARFRQIVVGNYSWDF